MDSKKQQKEEAVKEQILVTAEAEFSEHGYSGARVDAIAMNSGINKRIIYKHFESKELLYTKVLIRVYERLAESEREYMTDCGDPVASIRNIVRVSFRFLNENPSFVRMLLWENLNRAAAVPRDVLVSLKGPSFEYIREQIRKGQRLGIFREDVDVAQIVLSLNYFCFSYFSNMYTMSILMDKNMNVSDEISARAEFVADAIIKYLVK